MGKTRETIHFRLRRKNERKDRQRESLATVESFRRRRLYFFLVPHTRVVFPCRCIFYQRERERGRERETFSSSSKIAHRYRRHATTKTLFVVQPKDDDDHHLFFHRRLPAGAEMLRRHRRHGVRRETIGRNARRTRR